METIIDKFKTAETAEELRAITIEDIRKEYEDITIVCAENMQKQLLRLANSKEIEELKQIFLTATEGRLNPNTIIEAKRIKNYPCIMVWPKGKWQEDDDE